MASHEAATKGDIESVVLLIQQLIHQLESKVDRLDNRFDAVDRRFEAMENRLDRLGDTMILLNSQVTTFTRWAESTDRAQNSILGTQTAQQKAIDSLNERVTRLEQRNEQRNQN